MYSVLLTLPIYEHLQHHPALISFTGTAGAASGPIENTFVSILTDYGLAAFALYLGIFIAALKTAFTSKKENLRVHALYVIFIMIVSAFIDMEYWINLAYFVWIFAGLYLGEVVQDEYEVLKHSMVFSTAIGFILLLLPMSYGFIRTLLNIASQSNTVGLFFFMSALSVVSVIVVVWYVTSMTLCLFEKKVIVRHQRIFTIAATGFLVIVLISIKIWTLSQCDLLSIPC